MNKSQNQRLILKQKNKHRLTFEEICPIWSENLKTKMQDHVTVYDEVIGGRKTLSIHHPQLCVVGEAHAFSDDYYFKYDKMCEPCKEVGDKLQMVLCRYDTVTEIDDLVQEFVDHWNEVHIK